MRASTTLTILALAFACSPLVAQSSAKVDNSFCVNDPKPEVRAFCPALVNYLNSFKDLKAYIAEKGYPDIFSTPPSTIRSNAAWTARFTADELLKAKVDTFIDQGQKISPEEDKAIHSVIIAFHQAALEQGTNQGLTTLAQTLTNTAANNFTSRLDEQPGGGVKASGTTSLTSSAGSADLVSIAEEAGALTQSVNGATTTYNTNAETLFQIVTGSGDLGCIVCSFNVKTNGLSSSQKIQKYVFSPLNVSASYTIHTSSAATASSSGEASGPPPTMPVSSLPVPSGATTFTGITVKYQILNKFDLKNKGVRDKWKTEITKLAPPAANLTKDVGDILTELAKEPSYSSARHASPIDAFAAAANSASPAANVVAQFELSWNTAFPQGASVVTPALATGILTYFKDSIVYQQAWVDAVADSAGNLLTIQYNYNKQPSEPETHDSTVIYARSFQGQGVLNFNGALSIYNGALPAGAKYGRIHYGQVSGEYDRNLGKSTGVLQSQMSLAGYWQYQPEPSILNIPAGSVVPGTSIPLSNGTQLFVGTAGSLWVTQAKFTLKNSAGVSVPIGVSWSNKTSLLEGSKVGGQIGVSYNLQGLAGLFTGSSTTGK
jgi:hypothetical protein